MATFSGLGAGLVRLRRDRGLKAMEVAGGAGITKAMLSAYENGKQLPSLPSLEKILDVLEADLPELQDAMRLSRGEKRGRPRPLPLVIPILGGLGAEERAALAQTLEGFRRFCELLIADLSSDAIGPGMDPKG